MPEAWPQAWLDQQVIRSPNTWLTTTMAWPTPRVGPGPRLGCAGVFDERLDQALLDALAAARPQWQWLMVGPPRPNLHWLGQQHAGLVPALMAHWQLGILPFRIHAATRAAWPLKVGECLAAGLQATLCRLEASMPS